MSEVDERQVMLPANVVHRADELLAALWYLLLGGDTRREVSDVRGHLQRALDAKDRP